MPRSVLAFFFSGMYTDIYIPVMRMNIFFFIYYIVTHFSGHLGVYSSSFFLLLKALKVPFCPK